MGKTLLLADDSVTIQKVVGISFASEDIAIVTVDNGDDAITKARELRPDVILADVVMPGKSGYEVCQAVKADPTTSHVPVLLLTGTFEAFDEERAQAVGAAGHVSKPFEAQTLVDQVRELLANPPAQKAPAAAAPSLDAPTSPGGGPSFDFFDDAGDDFALTPTTPSPAAGPLSPVDTLDPADDSLDIGGGGDAFAFGDDDLGDSMGPLGDLTGTATASPDATVAIIPEGASDPGATVVDAAFLSPDEAGQGNDPVGFPFGAEEPPSPSRIFDPNISDSLAISSSDLLEPQAPNAMAMSDPVPAVEAAGVEDTYGSRAVDPLLAGDALDAGIPLPELDGEPLGDDLGFAVPLDDPMEVPAAASPSVQAPLAPAPEPVAAAPYSAQPFAEALDAAPVPPSPASPEPLRAEPHSAAPAPSPDATTFMPVEPEPTAMAPAPRVAEVPILAEPEQGAVAVPVDLLAEPAAATPEPLASAPEPPPSSEPLMSDVEPLMDPEAALVQVPAEAISAEAVNRLVEEVAPALREELHQTLERVAWESFGAITEQLVAQAVERIETIAWEVVPKLAETLIEEEIRKLKERS